MHVNMHCTAMHMNYDIYWPALSQLQWSTFLVGFVATGRVESFIELFYNLVTGLKGNITHCFSRDQ